MSALFFVVLEPEGLKIIAVIQVCCRICSSPGFARIFFLTMSGLTRLAVRTEGDVDGGFALCLSVF